MFPGGPVWVTDPPPTQNSAKILQWIGFVLTGSGWIELNKKHAGVEAGPPLRVVPLEIWHGNRFQISALSISGHVLSISRTANCPSLSSQILSFHVFHQVYLSCGFQQVFPLLLFYVLYVCMNLVTHISCLSYQYLCQAAGAFSKALHIVGLTLEQHQQRGNSFLLSKGQQRPLLKCLLMASNHREAAGVDL